MNAPPGIARTSSSTQRIDFAGPSGGNTSAEGGNQIAPHVSQQARDAIDDLGLVDHKPAGDDETAPEVPVRQHRAGAVHTHQPITESR